MHPDGQDSAHSKKVAEIVARNYRAITERIATVCHRCGREPSEVKMIAVVKYAEWDWVRELLQLGAHDLGESRPQQLVERAALVDSRIQWHLIGHLQRNKIRRLLPHVTLIHSIDSLKLLDAVNRIAEELALTSNVLLQVNVTGEASKTGFSPAELRSQWGAILACKHVAIQGLMTMAARSDTPEAARPTFATLRSLRDELLEGAADEVHLPELSMGMSGDFEVAIEEGATLLRIGGGLFRDLGRYATPSL